MGGDAHYELSTEARDRIALYVLDGMREDEASRFEEHLLGCAACRSEVTGLRPVASDLVLSGPSSNPPAGLKARVLARTMHRHFALRSANRRIWHASDVPGGSCCEVS